MKGSERDELLEIAEDAYVWGSPLVMFGEYRNIRESWYFPRNRAFGQLGIIESEYAPAQELIYSLFDFDLSEEPQVLRLPPTGDRYYSIQLCDKFFNPFRYIGKRTGETKGGDYALVPPGWSGSLPPGVIRVDCPVDRMMCYGRTLMAGKDDADAAIEVARQYAVTGVSNYPSGFKGHFQGIPGAPPSYFPAPWRGDAEGIRFFDKLGFELVGTPVPPKEQTLLERFRRVHVGPGLITTELADTEMRELLAEAVERGQERIDRCESYEIVNGWHTPVGVGETYTDFELRAQLQAGGGGFNVREECLYFRAYEGSDGEPLVGTKRYRLHLPADALPPVDAFWSIQQLDAIRGYPIPNKIKRPAISSIMDDLQRGKDGSLTILLQKDEPKPGEQGMWLPVGDDGFQLFMRFYLPGEALLSGEYEVPRIEVTG